MREQGTGRGSANWSTESLWLKLRRWKLSPVSKSLHSSRACHFFPLPIFHARVRNAHARFDRWSISSWRENFGFFFVHVTYVTANSCHFSHPFFKRYKHRVYQVLKRFLVFGNSSFIREGIKRFPKFEQVFVFVQNTKYKIQNLFVNESRLYSQGELHFDRCASIDLVSRGLIRESLDFR